MGDLTDDNIYTKEKIFKEGLKVEKFVIDPNSDSVVCDHCMSNCGQCGVSTRLRVLNNEYSEIRREKRITEAKNNSNMIDFVFWLIGTIIMTFIIELYFYF